MIETILQKILQRWVIPCQINQFW